MEEVGTQSCKNTKEVLLAHIGVTKDFLEEMYKLSFIR